MIVWYFLGSKRSLSVAHKNKLVILFYLGLFGRWIGSILEYLRNSSFDLTSFHKPQKKGYFHKHVWVMNVAATFWSQFWRLKWRRILQTIMTSRSLSSQHLNFLAHSPCASSSHIQDLFVILKLKNYHSPLLFKLESLKPEANLVWLNFCLFPWCL